jgi:CspA family cold shock protein
MTGIIKKKTDKGFGFITSPESEKDFFFHSNGLVGVTFNDLQEGDKVTFDTEESPKGINAINVQLA